MSDSPIQRVVGLLITTAAVGTVLLPRPLGTGLAALALVGIATWAARHTAWTTRETELAAFCWGIVGVAMVLSFGLIWPIPPAIGLVIAFAAWKAAGQDRPLWFSRGTIDAATLWLAAVAAVATTAALTWFITSGRTDLNVAAEGLTGIPTWVVPFAGLGFALVNPTVEEVLFRGALQTALTRLFHNAPAAILTQGVAFGAIHLAGVPGGPLGMLMAGIWGTVLGVVRFRTGSIALAWVVHVVANATMFIVIVIMARSDGII